MAKQTIKHGAEIETITPEEMERLLRGRTPGHGGIFDVLVGNFQGPEPVLMTNPPMRRLRVTRSGYGTELFNVPINAPVSVLDANEGRLGGQIVNYGASACFIYLAALSTLQVGERPACPALWLSAGGGSWDFEVSGVVWGGSVCAMATGAPTTLTIAEL